MTTPTSSLSASSSTLAKAAPVIAQATKRGKLQTKFGSVFCNDGDVVLAVRWLVRDESDAERRTFYEPNDADEAGSVIPVNSTELRHAGFGLTVLEHLHGM